MVFAIVPHTHLQRERQPARAHPPAAAQRIKPQRPMTPQTGTPSLTWMGLVILPTLCTASTPKCAVTRRLCRSWPVFSRPVKTRWHCRSDDTDTGNREFAGSAVGEGRPSKSHSWSKIKKIVGCRRRMQDEEGGKLNAS